MHLFLLVLRYRPTASFCHVHVTHAVLRSTTEILIHCHAVHSSTGCRRRGRRAARGRSRCIRKGPPSPPPSPTTGLATIGLMQKTAASVGSSSWRDWSQLSSPPAARSGPDGHDRLVPRRALALQGRPEACLHNGGRHVQRNVLLHRNALSGSVLLLAWRGLTRVSMG